MVLFVLWMTLAGIYGVNFSSSFWSSLARGTGLLTLYHCLALSFVVMSIVKREGDEYIVSLFKWFIAGAFILALSVWLGPGGFGSKSVVLATEGGLMGNSSLAAVYLTFALGFSVFLFFHDKVSKIEKWLISFAVFTILFSPIFINISGLFNGYGLMGSARASVLTLPLFVCFFTVFYFLLSQKKSLKIVGLVLFLLGAISFSYFWVQLITPDTYLHTKFTEEARGSRFIFWSIASQAMSKHPFLGYGPENYFIAFQENFNPDLLLKQNSMEGFDDKAHNIYFDTGISGGYPAIALYLLFLLGIYYAIYKAKISGKITQKQAAILGSLVAGYVFQNLFAFDSNLSLMILFIFAGIFYALGVDSISEKKNYKEAEDDFVFVLLATISFLVCFIFFVYMPAGKSKLYAETFASPINQRADMYRNLLSGSPVGEDWDISGLAFDTYRTYSTSAISIKNDKENLPFFLENLNALIAYLYKISEINKIDYRLYISIANLENTLTYLSGIPSDTQNSNKLLSILETAEKLAPNNPNVYWAIAQTKIWLGDFKGTEEAYRQALNVAPHLPGSYSLFLRYAQALNNQKLFTEIITKAKDNVPDFTFQ
jgi:tetratricopeptide (TPR) repeat protein